MTQNDQNSDKSVADPEPVSDHWPVKAVKGTWTVINAIAAILTLVVLFGAILVPPVIGRGGTSSERMWQGIGVIVFLGGLVAMIKKINLSFLYLGLACAFFFVSCASNFYWKGG